MRPACPSRPRVHMGCSLAKGSFRTIDAPCPALFWCRTTPPSNYMFVTVNGALIAAMIAGAVIELYVKPDTYNPPIWAGGM